MDTILDQLHSFIHSSITQNVFLNYNNKNEDLANDFFFNIFFNDQKKWGHFIDKWVLTSVNLTNFANFWKIIGTHGKYNMISPYPMK
jgi:hypothetical protein